MNSQHSFYRDWNQFLNEISYENLLQDELRNLILCNIVTLHPSFYKKIDIVNLLDFLQKYKNNMSTFPNLIRLQINESVHPPRIYNKNDVVKNGLKIRMNDNSYIILEKEEIKNLFSNKKWLEIQYENEDFFKGLDGEFIREFMVENGFCKEYCFTNVKITMEDFWCGLDECQSTKEKSDFSMGLLKVMNKYPILESKINKRRLYRYAFSYHKINEIDMVFNNKDLFWIALVPTKKVIKDFDKYHNPKDLYKERENHVKHCSYCNITSNDLPYLKVIKNIELKKKDCKEFGIVNRFILQKLVKNNPNVFYDFICKKILLIESRRK